MDLYSSSTENIILENKAGKEKILNYFLCGYFSFKFSGINYFYIFEV